ncbi:MAG: transporter substrate-binding domain-containing protein [Erysipelotrichaceae bacterium]|nr:transporter substrate-binding domain-containing protein [Erysipelotrichaceae bacterium]
MRQKNIIISLLLALFLVAGCSSNVPSETPSNVLRVGMECDYAPFNWSTTEPGEFTKPINDVDYADGYDVVIASLIAEDLGMDVQIVKLDWDNLILSLQNDQIDLIIAGMTDTKERRQEVSFTTPYYISEEVVIVKKDSDLSSITSISELSGRNVIGQLNTIYDDIIDQIEGVNHLPGSDGFGAAIQALKSGAADAVTSELPVAIGVCSANPELTYVRFESGLGFSDENGDATVSIAVKKENTELLSSVQASLDRISEEDRQAYMTAATERQPAGE